MSEVNLDGFGGFDPEVDAAFAEAFGRTTDTQTQEDVTPGEEPAASEGQPRDEQGRFASTAAAEETAEVETEEAPAEEPEQDDEVTQFLAKYGGDPDKALKAAVELSRRFGSQGDELGQLRQELNELRQGLQQPQQQPQPQQHVPITEEVIDALDALAVQDGHAALQRVAQLGDPTGQLTERVMDVWFSVNPRQASAFQAALIAQQTEQRVRAEFQPVIERTTISEEDQRAIGAWEIASSQRQGLNELAENMKAVFEARPGLARAAASAETPEELADIYLAAADLAAPAAPAATEVAEIAQAQQAAALAAAKKGARVVKPSAVGAAPGESPPEKTEADRIREGIEKAGGTSILDGLTYG